LLYSPSVNDNLYQLNTNGCATYLIIKVLCDNHFITCFAVFHLKAWNKTKNMVCNRTQSHLYYALLLYFRKQKIKQKMRDIKICWKLPGDWGAWGILMCRSAGEHRGSMG